jgi:anti-sigma B factor antagonist
MQKSSVLNIHFDVLRDCPVVRLSGTLDASTAVGFRHDVQDLFLSGYRSLLMDFSELGFMDSSGIGAILTIYRTLRDHGGKELWIAGSNPNVRSLLEVTQLDKQLRCFDSVPKALDAWKSFQAEKTAQLA